MKIHRYGWIEIWDIITHEVFTGALMSTKNGDPEVAVFHLSLHLKIT